MYINHSNFLIILMNCVKKQSFFLKVPSLPIEWYLLGNDTFSDLIFTGSNHTKVIFSSQIWFN